MKAAWYERQGPARDVLTIGEMPNPVPDAGEVRIRMSASGINPGDVKKRSDTFGIGMPFPRVIPHSDGSGEVDQVGEGVSPQWIGQRVWCYGAQSYRPFGTAAEFTVVPLEQIAPLPASISYDQGACLGIPGITAHRAVHVAGPVAGRTILIQGAAGSVGLAAVALARLAGANVIGSVRSSSDEEIAREAGAQHVVLNDQDVAKHIKSVAPSGIDHIVEVAFGANIHKDIELLNQGGSIATYATDNATPSIPFWPLVFQNVKLFFLGSDDFPKEVKIAAAKSLTDALKAGWSGFAVAERVPLSEIAHAHESVEHPTRPGRVVVTI